MQYHCNCKSQMLDALFLLVHNDPQSRYNACVVATHIYALLADRQENDELHKAYPQQLTCSGLCASSGPR